MRPYPFARYVIPPIMSLWTRKVTGVENLPIDRPFILASNHSSYIEHLMIGSHVVPRVGKKIHFLAKKEHFDNVLERTWHQYLEAIPLDRSKGEDALKVAVDHLKQGKLIMIYPEGTRTLTGKIQQGKTGIARLALWSQVPVIPLGIIGTFEILPKGKIIPRLKRAELHFGKPLELKNYHKRPITKKLLREVTDLIMKEIARLSNQEYPY